MLLLELAMNFLYYRTLANVLNSRGKAVHLHFTIVVYHG